MSIGHPRKTLGYCTALAAILRKAQGVFDSDRQATIDIGKEVQDLRGWCDWSEGEISTLHEAYDALWKEKELLLKVLKDWQEFAADVRASDAAGQDWLDGLKARTARIIDPCS